MGEGSGIGSIGQNTHVEGLSDEDCRGMKLWLVVGVQFFSFRIFWGKLTGMSCTLPVGTLVITRYLELSNILLSNPSKESALSLEQTIHCTSSESIAALPFAV